MPVTSGPVRVEQVDAATWVLLGDLEYVGTDDRWVVPAGFRTDFASVPRVAVWLIPRYGAYTPAAIIHDWLCGPGIRDHGVHPVDVDGVFRRVLREHGVSAPRRWLMWTGVRLGAAASQTRRRGWWSTAPRVAVVTLAAVPLVVPAGLVIAAELAVFAVVERVAHWLADDGTPPPSRNLST